MGFLKQKPPVDPEAILRDYEEQIAELVEALLAGADDVDIRLAKLVEGAPEHVRTAIVEKMRELVAARDEAKARELDQWVEQQRMIEKQKRAFRFQQMLAFLMSEETLRKLRESFLARPYMQKEVENIGQELAKNGVLQSMQHSHKQDLGELSASVQQGQRQGQDKGQGRG